MFWDSHLETIWCFQSSFKHKVRQNSARPSSNIPRTWGRTLLYTLPDGKDVFQSVLWELPLFPAVFEMDCITSNAFEWILPWLQVISSPAHPEQYSSEHSREVFPDFSSPLCSSLPCSALAANSSHGGVTRLCQVRGPTRLSLCSLSLCYGLETLLRQWAGAIIELTLFVSLHSKFTFLTSGSSLLDAQCL